MAATDERAAQGVLHQFLTEHSVWINKKTHIWKLSGELPSDHVCQRCAIASDVFLLVGAHSSKRPKTRQN